MTPLTIPLYLGKDRYSDTFYFFANKDGFSRFIKYSKYPFWCASVDVANFLVLAEVPVEIIEQVMALVDNRLSVEIIAKTRGRAERVIVSVVPLNSAQEKVDTISNESTSNPSVADNADFTSTESTGGNVTSTQANVPKMEENILSIGYSLPPSQTGKGTSKRPGNGGLRKADVSNGTGNVRRIPGNGTGNVRRIPGNGYGSAVGYPELDTVPNGKGTDSGVRRKSISRVLGQRGDDPKSVPQGPTLNQESSSTLNGSITPKVRGPIATEKVRRPRRTKAQMMEARALEAALKTP